jgi:protein-S-isoprenylcysteine O-methyltransferase Ste14
MKMRSFREKIFSLRGYTPVPFLVAMIFFAQPNTSTMIIGLIIVISGEILRFWGVAYAGHLTRVTGSVGAPEVIVAGPFSYVRNPLYIGNVLIYCGIGIMSNALFPWLLTAAMAWFVFQYYEIILLEEEFLEKEFGKSYKDFKHHVPRFFPRLSPYMNPAQSGQLPAWEKALHSERRTFQALGLVLLLLCVIWYAR